MKIKFWGVRGSIPCPGPKTQKYGGNTACIEVRFNDNGRYIIIDAGSGIRELGNYLVSRSLKKAPINTDILITHTHWDHIMGFPFFAPIYIPDTKLRVYGPVSFENETLKDIIGGQLTYRYFPVRHAELSATIEYIDSKEGQFDLGDGIKLTTTYLNHPVLCLGYRLEFQNKVFCAAYDTEPFKNLFCTDPNDPYYDEIMAQEGEKAARDENRRVEKFLEGSDLLVYDAQYTQEEYETAKIGWGHTSIEYSIELSKLSGVKRLALFHHDPMRTDAQLDELTAKYCNPGNTGNTEVFFAREGMEIEI
jgi:phosphoribosyl 1,2-cyclic phosphodiesterase